MSVFLESVTHLTHLSPLKTYEHMVYVDEDKMMSLLVFCFLSVGGCLGLEVRQSPSELITIPGGKVQIFCSHDKTDYYLMLWYQRSPGDTAMKLIGYLYHKDVKMEEPYKKHFNLSGDLSGSTAKNASLIIQVIEPEQGAVYYCAAREGDSSYNEAYFGAGTKLTVLESGLEVTKPTVKVLKPSQKECRNSKAERKKTLVCVASQFYPDHVSVNWEIDGANVEDGVATDNAALRNGSYYKITSRLRVFAEDWNKEGINFTCIVSFFNGKETITVAKTIQSVKEFIEGKNVTRDKYMRITHTAKFSYGVFIAKSSIYGAFVAFLVWKLQGSNGKQNN